jgi:hypothetical protein
VVPRRVEVAAPIEAPLIDAETLDRLVAPVALYPDALLAQVFVASTYPLEVIKADRFVDDVEGLSDAERSEAAQAEDWDPSVQVLAAGFPDVIDRMAAELDWTEGLGEAVLTQTDDVLDAVQRMRARAAATGSLESNEAHVVETVEDTISIAPADPERVYVPAYDPETAYSTAPTAAPVVYEQGFSAGTALTTGAIAFGGAMVLSEIFDDDDDWDDYWRGPRVIDWDEDAFYPRPGGVDIDGDVNIDRTRIDIDRDRIGAGGRLGDRERDGSLLGGDGRWTPDEGRRQATRETLASRNRAGGPDGGPRSRATRDGTRSEAAAKLKARRPDGDGDARAKLKAAAGDRKPALSAGKRPESALKPKPGHGKAKAAANRGKASVGKSKVERGAAKRPVASGRPKQVAKPKKIAKHSSAKPKLSKKSPAKTSAFKKQNHGNKAKMAKARGGKHKAKVRRR